MKRKEKVALEASGGGSGDRWTSHRRWGRRMDKVSEAFFFLFWGEEVSESVIRCAWDKTRERGRRVGRFGRPVCVVNGLDGIHSFDFCGC
jgi:hypothetical protein